MKRSRRKFLTLLAAGTAAAVPVALTRAAAAARPAKPAPARAKTPAKPAPAPAFAEEIRKQKANVDQALKTVRDYPLPPGSDPAFVFRPLPAGRTERES